MDSIKKLGSHRYVAAESEVKAFTYAGACTVACFVSISIFSRSQCHLFRALFVFPFAYI